MKQTKSVRMDRFGLTSEEHDEVLAANGNRCALGPDGCAGPLCMDHKALTIRGLLCAEHNRLIGQFEQLEKYLPKFQDYLAGRLTTQFAIKGTGNCCSHERCREIAMIRGLCDRHYLMLNRKEKRKQGPARERVELDFSTTAPTDLDEFQP